MDDRSEANLTSNIFQPFADAVRAADAAFFAATGFHFVVIFGTRTFAQQHMLFLQGPSVTKADAGHSSHNFGMAVDIAPNHNAGDAAFVPDYAVFEADNKTMTPHWATVVQCMKAQGLKWGGDWVTMKGDYGHFYVGPDSPNQAMRDAFTSGGFQAVWDQFANFPA